jgi:pyruvate kinase
MVHTASNSAMKIMLFLKKCKNEVPHGDLLLMRDGKQHVIWNKSHNLSWSTEILGRSVLKTRVWVLLAAILLTVHFAASVDAQSGTVDWSDEFNYADTGFEYIMTKDDLAYSRKRK